MAMTCRRCGGAIRAGEVANVIRSVIVGECCRRMDERGYDDRAGETMPQTCPLPVPSPPGVGLPVTRRRVEVMQLAEDGLVTRQGNLVNAFDRKSGKMKDSKSVATVLRGAGFAYWERLPMNGFQRESPRWVLRLTQEGRDWLAFAESKLEAADERFPAGVSEVGVEVDMRRVLEVLRYSQPHYRWVKVSAPPGRVWLLKSGRRGDFGMRCDRAVKRAIALGFAYVDEELRELRPTAAGMAELLKADRSADAGPKATL